MTLHKIVEVQTKEDWDRIRALGWRIIGQEDIEGGMSRVDFVDDENDAEVMAYSPTKLLPDALFWTNS